MQTAIKKKEELSRSNDSDDSIQGTVYSLTALLQHSAMWLSVQVPTQLTTLYQSR